ncbi:hypothetical protein B7486_23060 [cyanobacterium TDX16]|nr:hypothetical protein B7486_23060 [cyanobacterium TDX16]
MKRDALMRYALRPCSANAKRPSHPSLVAIASQLFDDTDRQRQKHETATDYLGGNQFEGHNITKLSATRDSLGTN